MDAGRGSTIFPMPQIPALLFPPPPPPLPSSYSFSSSTSSHHAPSITSFPILVLTVLGILTASVLLLAYYIFIIRCCLKWHHHSSPSDAAGHRGRRQPATSGTSSLPLSGAPPAEARGLEQAIIQALPAFRYRKAIKNAAAAADSASPMSECAVCLGEFEDEERVRMLPACLHVFHADCIDTWLQGSANCPLCRAAITCHCLLPPLDLHQLPRPDEVAIQVIPTTEQGEEATRAQQQQQASTAMASSESLRRSFSMGEMAGGQVHLGAPCVCRFSSFIICSSVSNMQDIQKQYGMVIKDGFEMFHGLTQDGAFLY